VSFQILNLERNSSQGLKPDGKDFAFGTAEAVPYPFVAKRHAMWRIAQENARMESSSMLEIRNTLRVPHISPRFGRSGE